MKSLYLILFVLGASCNFPIDSKDTLARAERHGLRVGIVHNPPFTIYKEEVASGYEVALVEEFAKQEGLHVNYISGSETTLVKELEEYRIDLIIGGFEKNTVWKDKAGLTTRYNDKNVLLVAKGENQLLYRLESVLLKHKENEH